MKKKIIVAGATGNLGKRIVAALARHEADVVALVRPATSEEKASELRALGAHVAPTDLSSVRAVSDACTGASCVVSALQGLRDVIVETQSRLLHGAVAAKVPRFVPSDFSTDFTKVPEGENRNFDLRRDFHRVLDAAPIASTSIFNGAFAEILGYGIPLLDRKKGTVGFWEDADWAIDFTTMDDTAAYTAAVAVDDETPRALGIASFQVSPRALAEIASDVLHTPFHLVAMGSREELRLSNVKDRAAHPEGERETFPRWQQSQYLHSMFTAHHAALDNARYPGLTWTSLPTLLATMRG